MKFIDNVRKSVKLFFENPEPGGLKGIFSESHPDWDGLVKFYFGDELQHIDKKYVAELKMRLMELEEQKKSTQRNVEMLWRSQILTAITTVISLFIAVVALLK